MQEGEKNCIASNRNVSKSHADLFCPQVSCVSRVININDGTDKANHLFQVFPGELQPVNIDISDVQNLTRSEVDRRADHFALLENSIVKGQCHPLVLLSKDCLNNDPTLRPSTEHVLTALEEMEEEVEGPYGEFSRLDAVRQVSAMKAMIVKDVEVREKTNELSAKSEKIRLLRRKLEHEKQVHNISYSPYQVKFLTHSKIISKYSEPVCSWCMH